MRIRSLMLAGVALAGFATVAVPAAQAADYPVLRGSQIEDAPAPREFFGGTPNWGGFYVGGTAGYSTSSFDAERQSVLLSNRAFNQLAVSEAGSPLLRFGKAVRDTTSFGGFIGYNTQFGDAVFGFEGEYLKINAQTDQRGSIARLFTDLFSTNVQSAPNIEPNNTQTAISVSGHSTTKVDDLVLLKARGGYGLGNFMPFATIGLAIGRISTDADLSQSHTTVENFGRFNTITDPVSGSVSRTTFIGTGSLSRPDAGGQATATQISSGYVPGLSIGGGIDALLGDNILLRAEYNRIYFSEYKGVNVVIDSARIGAGIKF